MQLTPLYGVRGSASKNFGFGTYVRLGRPTYGFVHDFRTCFWMRWFSVHGFGHDGFRSMVLDVSTCINMYYNIERNIVKNQASSHGFWDPRENLCVYVFYLLCSRIVYFLCFRIHM